MSEMDQNYRFPVPGMSNALFPVSPDRTNQQRSQHSRESSVSDQVSKFNTMASITRNAERGVNDAALRRAMMAREEAQSEARKYRIENESLRGVEAEMRRHRDEAGQYKKEVKIISERFENLVEQFMAEKENHSRDKAKLDEFRERYARTKETHETTQKTWERELRSARKMQKENFKVQSRMVQLQDELRSAKNTITLMKVTVDEEKERTKAREEEAFAARCELVSVQEELTNTKEQVKLVEQERDALRTIAKNEEILRIAAEGHLPLPSSPRKPLRIDTISPDRFVSSTASEEEIEELKWKMQYEKQKVERAYDLIDFMNAECQFQSCSCRISGSPAPGIHHKALEQSDEQRTHSRSCNSPDGKSQLEKHESQVRDFATEEAQDDEEEADENCTTVFIPSEGIFRTVPSPIKKSHQLPLKRPIEQVSSSRPTSSSASTSFHARTPSFDPPAPAIKEQINTSLLSLVHEAQSPLDTQTSHEQAIEDDEDEDTVTGEQTEPESPSPHKQWQTISTTTRIPLKPDENTPIANKTLFSNGHYPVSNRNFDTNSSSETVVGLRGGDNSSENTRSEDANAIIGTMTKEQALAQIKLRRGRAQSFAQGTLTPRKKMCEGVGSYERRDISAPAAVAMQGFAARTPKSAPANKTKFGI